MRSGTFSTKEPIREFDQRGSDNTGPPVQPRWRPLAASGTEGTASLWDVATAPNPELLGGLALREPPGVFPYTPSDFAPDGKRLLTTLVGVPDRLGRRSPVVGGARLCYRGSDADPAGVGRVPAGPAVRAGLHGQLSVFTPPSGTT